jgi:hypothetical protein
MPNLKNFPLPQIPKNNPLPKLFKVNNDTKPQPRSHQLVINQSDTSDVSLINKKSQAQDDGTIENQDMRDILYSLNSNSVTTHNAFQPATVEQVKKNEFKTPSDNFTS